MNTTTSPISVKLAHKVAAKNKINSFINEKMHTVSDYFKPYVGKKIVITTGDFIKKIADTIPNKSHSGGEHFEEPHFYIAASRYSLILKVSMSYYRNDDKNLVDSMNDEIYIGELDSGVLLMLNELDTRQRKVGYSVEEIIETRKQLEIASLQKQTLESKLFGFGDYDR